MQHACHRKLLLHDASHSSHNRYLVRPRCNNPPWKKWRCMDVAHAVLSLVSSEARHITGTELLADGGISVAMP